RGGAGARLEHQHLLLGQQTDELDGVARALLAPDVELLAERVHDAAQGARAVAELDDALRDLGGGPGLVLERVELVVRTQGQQPITHAFDAGLRVHPRHGVHPLAHVSRPSLHARPSGVGAELTANPPSASPARTRPPAYLAALIAARSSGSTLNRSPTMP